MDAGNDDFAFDGKVGEKKNITVRHSAWAWQTPRTHRSDRQPCGHVPHHTSCTLPHLVGISMRSPTAVWRRPSWWRGRATRSRRLVTRSQVSAW